MGNLRVMWLKTDMMQAIQGCSAVESGIRSIPLVVGLVVIVILTGISVGRIG